MRSFLEKVLDPYYAPQLADIEELLKPQPTREGQYLEYKRDEWLNSDRKKAPRRLRKWVSSFANSDGGVLIVGVTDADSASSDVPSWTVSGCQSPGKSSLRDWAEDALRPLGVLQAVVRVFLAPGAAHGSKVLVVATRRSARLVPCIEDGREVFYVRLGSSTLLAENWLLRDLFLNRRARPNVVPTPDALTYDVRGGHIGRRYAFEGALALENASPVWARSLHVAIVGLWEHGAPISDIARASVHPVTRGLGTITQVIPGLPQDLPPFGRLDSHFCVKVLDDPSISGRWIVCGAVLVASRDDLPRWMQLVAHGSTEMRGVSMRVFPIDESVRPLVFVGTLSDLSADKTLEPLLRREILRFVAG